MNHPERVIQSHIVQLLRSLAADVFVLGTTRRRGDHPGTMMSAGLPDVIAFLPASLRAARLMLIVEAKAPGGRLRPQQQRFRECCQASSVNHVVGGLDEVIAWLIGHGYLKADQVAHYHVKPEPRPHAAEQDLKS